MIEQSESMERIAEYWRSSSDRDHTTMQNLVKSKDYSWALFLGHLVIEKLLKAVCVKTQMKQATFTHDLLRLARSAELTVSVEIEEWLDEISTFNLNARYDNYKQDFHRLCTPEFTLRWVKRIEEVRTWLIGQL